MNRLKVIKPSGAIETVYKHENAKLVESFFELVVLKSQPEGAKIYPNTFVDGCKGVSITKPSGAIYQYKLELK